MVYNVSGRQRRQIRTTLVIAALATTAVSTGPSLAQQVAAIDEIIVTSRKRAESLSDVPMAISALTSQDFGKFNLTELSDIAKLTPGFSLSQYGTQRVRRANQTLFMRGVSRGGTGIFINGAPGGSNAATLTDLERVEVLKGPQSAYFGRSTFAGAINYITKTPSETWAGSVEALAGTENWLDVRGTVEGPVVPEALTFRLSARHYNSDGQYTSAFDGRNVTEQQTRSYSLVLDYHPSEALKVVLVGMYNKLDDGVPMQAKFRRDDFNCNAGVAPVGQNNYLCGKLPQFPENRIGGAFFITGPFKDILFNNSLNFPNPSGVKPIISTVGDAYRDVAYNLRADYTLSNGILDGVTVSYLGAITGNKNSFLQSSLGEVIGTPNPNFGVVPNATPNPSFTLINYTGWNYEIYHEVRITGPQENRLRWMAGTSYSKPLTPTKINMLYGVTTTGAANFGTNINNFTRNYTKPIGLFGSLAYDITEDLQVTAETRYQYDRLTVRRLAPGPSSVVAQSKDWKLMPRVSIQYNVEPETMIYASWARGAQPASFNTTLFTVPQSTVDIVVAQTGAGLTVDGEQIDMYELGVKGQFFDGRLAANATVYYGNWTDQVIPQSVIVPNPTNPNVITILRPNTNLGKTELSGIELDGSFNLTEQFTGRAAIAYSGVKIKRYNCAVCEQSLTGQANVAGNRLAGAPAWAGNLLLEYRDSFRGDTEWYANMQAIYSGKFYADDANLAWTNPRETVDVRLGLDFGDINVEAFVLNLFDDYYHTSATRDSDLFNSRGVAFNNAIFVGLPEKRRFGLRAKYALN